MALWVFALLLLLHTHVIFAADIPNAPPADMTGGSLILEEAKANLLKLDRDLSSIEQELLLPERTLILFGIPIGSQIPYQFVRIAFDKKTLLTKPIAPIEITSMSQGGMMTLFDDNFSAGKHQLDIEIGLANGQSIRHSFIYNKQTKTNKSILGIRVLERVPPNSPPIKVVEWPLTN